MDRTLATVSLDGLTTDQLGLVLEALDETWPAEHVSVPVEVTHLRLVVMVALQDRQEAGR